MLKIDFYYWNTQCPINYEMKYLLDSLDSKSYTVNCIDVTNRPSLAKEINLYFPFIFLINDTIRWHSPLSIEQLTQFEKGIVPKEKPYLITQSANIFEGTLVELNKQTIHNVRHTCTMTDCKKSCEMKGDFLSNNISDFDSNFFGYLHFKGDALVGGVEYLPSLAVPYSIPKSTDIAFLSCLYRSSSEYDYKAYPLKALEDKLSNQYIKIVAITGETGVFPNGDLNWFLNQGYADEGVLCIEKDYAILHLVSKKLSKS
ncbi:hypothetical protein [Anaeromicropila herbilytica]|uniref:Uncharacterized protein n=1 Tax=Anaeromicropila herbilytica TaxID=2785025 RepID=A0A7R7IC59_9FIRM|nr:hypothetical protein [Anaeromicropila herbilytica]BCN30262.1 hypothetical protein bsdtb5_15570 [Anaeromicropila herbilytica]